MIIHPSRFPKPVIKSPESDVLRFARDELLKYARMIFGGDLSYHDGMRFSIGVDRHSDSLGEEGWRVTIGESFIDVEGGSEAAALYGVYCFLKDYCGCRFAAPGPNGEFVPELRELSLPETTVVRKPRLRYRGLQFIHRFKWDVMIDAFDWMAKNGFNYVMCMPVAKNARSDLRTVDPETGEIRDGGKERYGVEEFRTHLLPEITKRGLKLDMNHHNLLAAWLPPEKYFERHPEWYPLVDGERLANAPQLAVCVSNREAIDEIVANVRKFLAENPETDVVGIIPEDGFGAACECDNCRKLDFPDVETPSAKDFRSPEGENRLLANRYAMLLNQVASALNDEFPDVRIGALFYVDIQWPPRDVTLHDNIYPMVAMYWRCGAHAIGDGAGCRINAFFHDLLERWNRVKPNDYILYEYYMGMNAQAALPYPMGRVIIDEWPDLINLGVQGASVQANPLNFRAYGINYLAFAAAAWSGDHEGSCETVLDDWLTGMFGRAAPAIRPIFTALDAAVAKIAEGVNHECLKYDAPAIGHLLPDAANIVFFMDELTPAFIDETIAQAKAMAATRREKAQVDEFEAATTYWKLAADYFRLKRRALSPDFPGFTDEELNDFRMKFERLERFRLSIADTGWAWMSRPLRMLANLKRGPCQCRKSA